MVVDWRSDIRLNRKALLPLLGVLVFMVVLVGVAAPARADLTLSRPLNYSGQTHEQSAILLSKREYPSPGGAPAVVLSASDNYSVSLSAGVLAKAYDGPLLLTASASLGSDVAAELTRLHPTQVFVVGLPSSFVSKIVAAVPGLTADKVTTLTGVDRYATAALVAGALKAKVGAVERVVIVPGDSYAAGIAASPLACAQAWPLLLTPAAGPFPQASADAISSLGATSGIIVGTNVTPEVADFSITARIIGTTSTNDPDGRYDASLKLNELAVEQGWQSYAHVGLTRGDDFPEAMVIAPYLARNHGVLLFSKSSALTSAAVTTLTAHGTEVDLIDMLGLGWSVYRQVKILNTARVAALSSTSGPVAGGNSVVVTGTSFSAVSKVRVGKVDVAPENWRLDSDTQITILAMPPGFGRGPAEITLSNYWGPSRATVKDLYTYLSEEPMVAGDKVVQEALKYLGVSYLWGGASPTSGFDCSGLVMYVYKKFGVSLPHRSLYQANYGTPVSKDDLLPGDLVFFYTPISHVGMYVGGGLMINAPRNGDLVCIEDVFRESYVKARRMLSPYTRYQQTDARLVYTGKWSTGNSTSASGGSYGYANTSGSSLTVAFNGTHLNWVTKKSPSYGKASVSLDGGAAVEVSLYSSSTLYQQKVWTTGKLPLGPHTVTIRWTGAKGASTGGTNIGSDAFDVIGSLIQAPPPLPAPTRYQDTHASLTFAGVWNYSTVSSATGGSFRHLDGTGSASVTFNGTSLSWVARKSPSYGVAKVTVDNGDPVLVDLYSPTSDYGKNVWNTGPLQARTHTVTIEWTGEKNAAATGTGISLDAFDVIGTLVRPAGLVRVEQTDSRLAYAGTWYTFSTTGPSSGSYKRANTSGTAVTVKFTGTYLSWIATAGTTLSKAYVSLDDGPAQTIDLARSAVAYQQSVWTTGTIPGGSHTVKIWWDTTNAAGKYISLDAFDVMGTLN